MFYKDGRQQREALMIEFMLNACKGEAGDDRLEKKVTRQALPRMGEMYAFTYPFQDGKELDKDYAEVIQVWHETDGSIVVDIEIENQDVFRSLLGHDGWAKLKELEKRTT